MNEEFQVEALAMFFIIFATIAIAMMFAGVLVQRYRTQERLRAIEKGVPLPSRPVRSPGELAANLRLAGIIFIAIGLGLLVLFTSLAATVPPERSFPRGVIAVSVIPLLLGLGFLIESRIRRKEADARGPIQ